jgi:phage terminase large subunit-like protein
MDKQEKIRAHDILFSHFTRQRDMLASIDPRLETYFGSLSEEPYLHNGYEILCGVKFLRLLRTYDFNADRVRTIIRLREGDWIKDERGRWKHIRGGIKCPGTNAAHVYRWQPFQVFVLASVFGFHAWFDTKVEAADKIELQPTEREREDGMVEDYRRLCNYFVLYTPRKTDKTGMSAFIQVVFFLLGDYNSEIYCCANAEFQSRILYGRTKFMLSDMDTHGRFNISQKSITWKPQYQSVRNSMIMPLTAGGKSKDGPFAELVNWDELGSSPYVNGKSDMMALVSVMRSSMGPRREGLTFGTTTAGTIKEGPFKDMLEGLHEGLMHELDYETGDAEPTISGDRQLCLLLEPDDWEKYDEEELLTSEAIRRKINPMLGITCQHQFYDDSIDDMRNGKMTREELFAKLFNVYQTSNTRAWLRPEDIRELQKDMRIDQCTEDDGWIVFAGFDFSKGDDLNGTSYLAHNQRTGEFFADLDAYMSEEAVNKSPIRELLRSWSSAGWLHIVPGKTFDPSWPVNRIIELDGEGINFGGFGYDPYNAPTVINSLAQWLFDEGLDPRQFIKPVHQGFAIYNPAVAEFDYMVKRSYMGPDGHQVPDPMIHFSKNPLWPWQFGNTVLKESSDGMENVKPVKRDPNGKMDNVQMLLSALIMFDAAMVEVDK